MQIRFWHTLNSKTQTDCSALHRLKKRRAAHWFACGLAKSTVMTHSALREDAKRKPMASPASVSLMALAKAESAIELYPDFQIQRCGGSLKARSVRFRIVGPRRLCLRLLDISWRAELKSQIDPGVCHPGHSCLTSGTRFCHSAPIETHACGHKLREASPEAKRDFLSAHTRVNERQGAAVMKLK